MAHEMRIGLSKENLFRLWNAYPTAGEGYELADALAVKALADKAYPPRGRTGSIRIRGKAQGEALKGLFSNMLTGDKTADHTLEPLVKSLTVFLAKHPLGDAPAAPPTTHGPEVKREAAAVVDRAVKDMLAVVRKSEYIDRLPKNWKPAVKISWNPDRRHSRGGAGGDGLYADGAISLALHSLVPADGKGGSELKEYASIARRTDIGTFASPDWRAAVRALVAHEVAHAVQRTIRVHARRRGMWAAQELDKPHGVGWQRIYSLLRTSCVNKWRATPVVEAPLSVGEDTDVGPTLSELRLLGRLRQIPEGTRDTIEKLIAATANSED
jgi:hypothetical protein